LCEFGIAAIFRQLVVGGDLFENLAICAVSLDGFLECRALFYQRGKPRLIERL
jgi:hypothetical protein